MTTDITIKAMQEALDTIKAVLVDIAQKEQESKPKQSVDEFDALFADTAPIEVVPEGWKS